MSLEPLQLLVVRLDEQGLGVPLTRAREVHRAVAVTPLPGAPPVVEGVIDLRGEIVPVLDLRRRLGMPSRPVDPDDRLVTVWTGERLVALRVDGVDRIDAVDPELVAPATDVTAGARRVAGIAPLRDGLLLVQDLEALLDAAEEESLAEALRDAGR